MVIEILVAIWMMAIAGTAVTFFLLRKRPNPKIEWWHNVFLYVVLIPDTVLLLLWLLFGG